MSRASSGVSAALPRARRTPTQNGSAASGHEQRMAGDAGQEIARPSRRSRAAARGSVRRCTACTPAGDHRADDQPEEQRAADEAELGELLREIVVRVLVAVERPQLVRHELRRAVEVAADTDAEHRRRREHARARLGELRAQAHRACRRCPARLRRQAAPARPPTTTSATTRRRSRHAGRVSAASGCRRRRTRQPPRRTARPISGAARAGQPERRRITHERPGRASGARRSRAQAPRAIAAAST